MSSNSTQITTNFSPASEHWNLDSYCKHNHFQVKYINVPFLTLIVEFGFRLFLIHQDKFGVPTRLVSLLWTWIKHNTWPSLHSAGYDRKLWGVLYLHKEYWNVPIHVTKHVLRLGRHQFVNTSDRATDVSPFKCKMSNMHISGSFSAKQSHVKRTQLKSFVTDIMRWVQDQSNKPCRDVLQDKSIWAFVIPQSVKKIFNHV